MLNLEKLIQEKTTREMEIATREIQEIISTGEEMDSVLGTTMTEKATSAIKAKRIGTIRITLLSKIKINRSKMRLIKMKNTTTANKKKKTKLMIDELKIRGATSVEAIKVNQRPTTKNMLEMNPTILTAPASSTKKRPIATMQRQLRRRIVR